MAKEAVPNRAYLIRCWRENQIAPPVKWRFTVEEVLHDKKRWGFDNLDELLAFLHAELTDAAIHTIKETRKK